MNLQEFLKDSNQPLRLKSSPLLLLLLVKDNNRLPTGSLREAIPLHLSRKHLTVNITVLLLFICLLCLLVLLVNDDNCNHLLMLFALQGVLYSLYSPHPEISNPIPSNPSTYSTTVPHPSMTCYCFELFKLDNNLPPT